MTGPDGTPDLTGAVLLRGRVPGISDSDDQAVIYCSKAMHQTTGAARAAQLLLVRVPPDRWDVRPRCAEHHAADDVALLAKARVQLQAVIVQLEYGDDQAAERQRLVMLIAELWKGDWSGRTFDGDDGHRWLDQALHGSPAQLVDLAAELNAVNDWYDQT